MRVVLMVTAGIALLGGFFSFWGEQDPVGHHLQEKIIETPGGAITVEVANTPKARRQGLSGRGNLDADSGMLFVFDEPGRYGIWMKDMQFSIDIVWLDAAGTVVHTQRNVSPDTYPRIFRPAEEARYVLELSGGRADELLLRRGAQITGIDN